jgi:hypothetical protein
MVLFEGWSFHEISVGKIAAATIGIVICRQIGRLPQKYKVGGGGGVVLSVVVTDGDKPKATCHSKRPELI